MDARTEQSADAGDTADTPGPTERSRERAPRRPGAGDPGARKLRIGAVVGVALAVAFAAWLLVAGDEDGSTAAKTTKATKTTAAPANVVGAPRATSLAALRKLVAGGATVYWAGPKEPGQTLTLVTSSNGSHYVRYLPAGVGVADPVPDSLVVATYPLENGLAAVERAAKKADAVSVPLDDEGTAVYSKSRPTNVYFAYPDTDIQVEVFHPADGKALQLVTSGLITPVAP
jgi:hypothetical protein